MVAVWLGDSVYAEARGPELRASRLDVPIINQPSRSTDVNRVTGGAICPTMVS
jgi:hypothetical protein